MPVKDEEELAQRLVALKDMRSGEQRAVMRTDVGRELLCLVKQ